MFIINYCITGESEQCLDSAVTEQKAQTNKDVLLYGNLLRQTLAQQSFKLNF